MKKKRFQYSLAILLSLVSGIAFVLFLWTKIGKIEAIGTVASALLVYSGQYIRLWLKYSLIGFVQSLSGILLLGIVTVDRSGFVAYCDRCQTHRYEMEYRVYGVSFVREVTRVHESLPSKMSVVLDAPFNHDFSRRLHIVRAWGMFYFTRTNPWGTCCLKSGHEEVNFLQFVRSKRRLDPKLGTEFRRRVHEMGDRSYYLDVRRQWQKEFEELNNEKHAGRNETACNSSAASA